MNWAPNKTCLLFIGSCEQRCGALSRVFHWQSHHHSVVSRDSETGNFKSHYWHPALNKQNHLKGRSRLHSIFCIRKQSLTKLLEKGTKQKKSTIEFEMILYTKLHKNNCAKKFLFPSHVSHSSKRGNSLHTLLTPTTLVGKRSRGNNMTFSRTKGTVLFRCYFGWMEGWIDGWTDGWMVKWNELVAAWVSQRRRVPPKSRSSCHPSSVFICIEDWICSFSPNFLSRGSRLFKESKILNSSRADLWSSRRFQDWFMMCTYVHEYHYVSIWPLHSKLKKYTQLWI